MSSQQYICSKCGGNMIKGFAADETNNYYVKLGWVDGEPQHPTLLGLEGSNVKFSREMRRDIRGLRCNKCGFLELYAV